MFNKRGQGLSTQAIILIVLGVFVLAILILGFTMGWKNIAPWLGGGDNVKTIVDACSVACGTQSQYDYCTVERELKDANDNEIKTTCDVLSTSYPAYGVAECPSVTCGVGKIHDNENEAKKACIKDSATLNYKDGTLVKIYKCEKGDLAESSDNAKIRCLNLKSGQAIQYMDGNNLQSYECASADITK